MATDSDKLKTLTIVTNEWQAAAIVSALEAEGIRAHSVGGFTAGWKAEAPGGVSVLVVESDLARAKEILQELKTHGADVDWSQLDFEQPDDGA
jgi:hypothetical protein